MPEVGEGGPGVAVLEHPEPPPVTGAPTVTEAPSEHIDETATVELPGATEDSELDISSGLNSIVPTESAEEAPKEEISGETMDVLMDDLEEAIDKVKGGEELSKDSPPSEKSDTEEVTSPEPVEIIRKPSEEAVEDALKLAGKKIVQDLLKEAGLQMTGKNASEIAEMIEANPKFKYLFSMYSLGLGSFQKSDGLSVGFNGDPLEVTIDGKTIKLVKITKINDGGTVDGEAIPEAVKTGLREDSALVSNIDRSSLVNAILQIDGASEAIAESLPEHQKKVFEAFVRSLNKAESAEIEGLETAEMLVSIEQVLQEHNVTTAGRFIELGIKPELVKDMVLITDPQVALELFDLTPENLLQTSENAAQEALRYKKAAQQSINPEIKKQYTETADTFEEISHSRDAASKELEKVGKELISAFEGTINGKPINVGEIIKSDRKNGINTVATEVISELYPKEAERIKGFLGKHGKTIGKVSLLAALGLMYALMKSGKEQPQYQ